MRIVQKIKNLNHITITLGLGCLESALESFGHNRANLLETFP
jgi:hypothetical protein